MHAYSMYILYTQLYFNNHSSLSLFLQMIDTADVHNLQRFQMDTHPDVMGIFHLQLLSCTAVRVDMYSLVTV